MFQSFIEMSKCFADCNVSETLETSTNIQDQTTLSKDIDDNEKHKTEFAFETIGLIAAVTVVILALIVTGVLIIKKCINR